MNEPVHFKLVGTTGCGKTTLMTRSALLQAEAGECGIAGFYPHPPQADALLQHLEDRNLLHRVVVKDLRDMKRVLPTALIRSSHDPDPFERKRQNHEYRDGFLSVVMRRRGDEVLSTRPAIERYAKLAVSVYQNLDAWLPASMI